MASVDLTQTHLKTSHVVALIVAIVSTGLSAGIYIGTRYVALTWSVTELANKQKEIPTNKDLTELKNTISVDLTHAVSERAKFYMEHARLECDAPVHGQHKMTCRLVWPPPED